ncbi:MAG: 2-phospho-L-lactate guanylyltransferase [Chloroflexota bacterium]|nr:2-phospho-L-lactate guanylyltransferase [Chloroflexota bacterium]
MAIWAIVPVKPLRRGKSRLADVFTQDERTVLNRYLLENTVSVLRSIPEIEKIVVVSRDQGALSLARDLGARTVQENGEPLLNVALERATIVAQTYEVCGVLILPADLPLVASEDIILLLEKIGKRPSVVIAPDRHRDGTNALLVSPAGLIEYHYGPDSFAKHCQLARQAGANLEICELSSLALDLDDPEDLALIELDLDIKTTD